MGKKGSVKSAYSVPKDVHELVKRIAMKKGTTTNKVIKNCLLDYCLNNKSVLQEKELEKESN